VTISGPACSSESYPCSPIFNPPLTSFFSLPIVSPSHRTPSPNVYSVPVFPGTSPFRTNKTLVLSIRAWDPPPPCDSFYRPLWCIVFSTLTVIFSPHTPPLTSYSLQVISLWTPAVPAIFPFPSFPFSIHPDLSTGKRFHRFCGVHYFDFSLFPFPKSAALTPCYHTI